MSADTTHKERAALLRARAEAPYPEAWIPEGEGDSLVGVFVRLDEGHTRYGPCRIAVFADPETGVERAVWLFHTVLRNELARLRPQPGELVCVRYEGRREPDGGGPAYESFRVVVDRDQAPVTWDDLLEPGDRERLATPATPPATEADDIPF